ncbi:MAG: hypothetical protein KKI09_01280 [Spirochaetes bacterium]|nr:hypothetical protein [Spirochaetota bacterium]MBU0954034.1 hypothetical protein [Spirochaetota bacterium]
MKKKLLHVVFVILLVLPAVFFLAVGFGWLVNPEDAAGNLMMPLLTGAALGSQMGDIGGMFLALGLMILSAIVWRKGDLLLAVSLVLACIVLYRFLAFAVHGAALSMQMIVLETILSAWLAAASRIMSRKSRPEVKTDA